MFFSETDLSDFIEENDVKFIRMTFCDTFGNMKNIAIMPRELHRAITDGIPFNATGLLEASHQNLLLNKEGFQLNILDILAQDEQALSAYQSVYLSYKKVAKELDDFIAQAEKSRQDEDYIRFQLEQLEEAGLKDGEQTELEQEAETLSHAEDIKAGLYKASQLINGEEGGTVSLTKECMQTLQSLTQVYAPAKEWMERLNSCYIELKDISREIGNAEEEVEFNPARLDFVNERLNLIYSLQQKHRVQSVEELIELTENYRSQLNAITSFDDRIAELEGEKKKLYAEVLRQAEKLTALRTQSARHIESQMESLLIPLGMPNVRFAVELTPRKEPDSKGMDSVTFLFSANKNGTLQNVASIASGGEIARVMLSLKAMIAGAVKLPTIIFDEIDTGVSGKAAMSIAKKLAVIAKNKQVICITHLPQLTAMADNHYLIQKNTDGELASTTLKELDEEGRELELARIIDGGEVTELALSHAKQMLENAKNN